MRTHCLTARGVRWGDELRAERENAARSVGALLKEGVAVRGGGRKRRPLTLFSASYPHPVQGVSRAALNALAAAPGRQVYRHLALAPPHPFQKQGPSHFAH
jgi:hypothetical protein